MLLEDLMDQLPILMAMLVPIVAITGGFALGIARIWSRHRASELAIRERIAAIENGAYPARPQATAVMEK